MNGLEMKHEKDIQLLQFKMIQYSFRNIKPNFILVFVVMKLLLVGLVAVMHIT